jgi:F-type H+-transporting ATPase subunit gamma
MATLREIKRRIRTSKNISQVTRAMEMVSAVKMRKAQEAALRGRDYVSELTKMVGVLSGKKDLEEKSDYMTMPERISKITILVVAPKKGLCGPLVTNLLRQLTNSIEKVKRGEILDGMGSQVDLNVSKIVNSDFDFSFVTLEKKSQDIAKSFNKPLIADFNFSGKQPTIEATRPISDFLVKQFLNKETDLVLVAYTQFVNTVSQKPVVKQFLPVMPVSATGAEKSEATIIFEPSAGEVLDSLLLRYVEASLYQVALEASASEHSARMVAMKNATENAGKMIGELNLAYNKARQAAITQELAELVAGAAAV